MAVANVVLNTKTYAYSKDVQGIITWLEKSGGIPTGFRSLSLSLQDSADAGKTVREQWVLKIPVVAAVDSACTCTGEVLRTATGRIQLELSPQSSTAERTDFALSMKDLAANAQFQSAIIDLTRPG